MADPSAKAYAFIIVNVIRNPNAPRFTDRFVFNISESQVLGSVFGTVTATDLDEVSIV